MSNKFPQNNSNQEKELDEKIKKLLYPLAEIIFDKFQEQKKQESLITKKPKDEQE